MRSMVPLLALALLLASAAYGQDQAPEPAEPPSADALVSALADWDAETADAILAEDALFVGDLPFLPDLQFAGKRELIDALAMAPDAGLEDIRLTAASDPPGQGVLVRATLPGHIAAAEKDMEFFGAATLIENEWKLVFGALLEPEDGDVPDGVATIMDDIETDEKTGMQAALDYWADDPSAALVTSSAFAMWMPDAAAVAQTVAQWAPPADVKVHREREVTCGARAALVSFASEFVTGNERALSENLVCLVKVGDEWKVVAFIADLAMKPLAAEEEAEEGEAEE